MAGRDKAQNGTTLTAFSQSDGRSSGQIRTNVSTATRSGTSYGITNKTPGLVFPFAGNDGPTRGSPADLGPPYETRTVHPQMLYSPGMGLFDIASSVLTSGLSGGTLGSSQPGGLTKQNVLGASEQPGSSGRPVGAGSELSQSILDGAMSAGR